MAKFRQKRKAWYRGFKKLTLIKYKRPQFIFLGEKIKSGTIILSNHEGTDAPMSLELHADFPIRFWGTAEMNSGLKRMYKYQSEVYYHEKKHWNLFLAKLFCLIASPLTNLFYKGLELISVYKDGRLIKTLRESEKAIADGDNIVIFPEKSDNGYEKELKGFYSGFVLLAERLLKKGVDVDVVVAYYKKGEKQYLFSEAIKYSELKMRYLERESIAKALVLSCNRLGALEFDKDLGDLENAQSLLDKEHVSKLA